MPPQLTSAKSKAAIAAQEFIPIESIRDGIIVLKGNEGLRAILMVSSLNFALKSEEEQDALVFQYENFLNSLDFPMQLVVQSRRLNILPYVETLAARQKDETNELLKVQISEYIEFIKTFVDLSHIVAKTFYAVVPFQPSVAERGGGILKSLTSFFSSSGKPKAVEDEEEFTNFRTQLLQRVDAVSLGLRRLGLRVAVLNTEELIELFYGLYNPGEFEHTRNEDKTGSKRS